MDGGRHDGFISKPYTRTGNNSAQDGLVEYSIEAKPEIKKIFEEAELPTPSFNQLKKNNKQSMDAFKNAIAKAKQSLGDYGASVELKDDYTDINLYLSEDGESGFGIKPNGDIVSVFSNNKAEGGRSAYMLEMAISQGGRQLDCFDVYLVEIYEAHGFKPVAKMKWNDEYIPEGWNKDNFKDYNNGEPDVVFMVYDPNTKKENEIPYITDYDDGDKIQQKYFAKNKVDSLIDAKKKEFKESDVNRDEDGKFAKKNSSNDKSNDNGKIKNLDTNALKDFGLNQRQIIKLTTKLEDLGIIEYNEDNDTYKIKSSITEGIENNEIKEILGDKFDIIKNSFNSDNNDNEDDIDNEKQKSLILKENDKRTIKERIKSLPKHLQETGNKLYNNNPIPSDLIIKDDANYDTEDILSYIDDDMVDEEKYSKLNEIETLLNRFTENAQGTRESNTFKRLKKDIEELIENAPPVKNPHRVEYMIEGRDDLSIGTVINFDIRSFADFGAGDKTANKIYNYLRDEVDPSKLVVYVIDDEVNGLDMTTISSYPNQNECLINGDFIISEVEEDDEYNPPIVHLKKHKK